MANTVIDVVITSLIQFHSFAFLIDLLISRNPLYASFASFSVERHGVPCVFDRVWVIRWRFRPFFSIGLLFTSFNMLIFGSFLPSMNKTTLVQSLSLSICILFSVGIMENLSSNPGMEGDSMNSGKLLQGYSGSLLFQKRQFLGRKWMMSNWERIQFWRIWTFRREDSPSSPLQPFLTLVVMILRGCLQKQMVSLP